MSFRVLLSPLFILAIHIFSSSAILSPSSISVPPNFSVSLAAYDVQSARYLAFSPDGTILFVGSYGNKIFAFLTENLNGSNQSIVIAQNLDHPTGVTIAGANDQFLVVSTTKTLIVYQLQSVIKFVKNKEDLITLPVPISTFIITQNGSQVHYITSSRLVEPEMSDYVFFTFPSIWNTNYSIPLPYATLMRVNITEAVLINSTTIEPEIIATGVRDSQGLSFSPVTKDLWFTDNGCEYLGSEPGQNQLCNFGGTELDDDLPPDEINSYPAEIAFSDGSYKDPLDYGFPECYGDNIPDPGFPNFFKNCLQDKVGSLAQLEAHQAPLGLVFYPDFLNKSFPHKFPSEFTFNMFVASHGSTYRTPKDGYDVLFVQLDPSNKAITRTSEFATGWLKTYPNKTQEVLGRPCALIVDPLNGSLLIADDFNNALYRISYNTNESPH